MTWTMAKYTPFACDFIFQMFGHAVLYLVYPTLSMNMYDLYLLFTSNTGAIANIYFSLVANGGAEI